MKRLVFLALVMAGIALGSFWAAWEAAREASPPVMPQEADAVARFDATRRDALAGDREARVRLGDLLRQGLGAPRDVKEAAKWYREALRQGSAEAQSRLGRMMVAGEGMPIDYIRAAELFRAAAQAGSREARFELGRLYYHGRGVTHDYGRAIELFRQAAEQGHSGAQFLMGGMIEEGWGMKEDATEAYKWYTLAARDPAGLRALDSKFDPEEARRRLRSRLSRFEVERGEELARDWRPKP
ncbi:MAG: sel1 repeat family protein [Magnetospirillum sp. WYHS-4]